MSQLAFPGLEEPARRPPTDRLFFALFPDAPVAQAIDLRAQALRREQGLTGRPIATDRLHVTLHHVDDFDGLPKAVVDGSLAAASTVAAAPFDVSFDYAMSFRGQPGKLPFVLRGDEGLAALEAFQRRLIAALAKAGVMRRKSEFTPHITLVYDGVSVPERTIEPIGWTVREFVLVHSLLGQTRHIILGRWPLQG